MNVKIVCAGKLKDRFYIDACAEYAKRLSRFCALAVCETADERIPENPTQGETRALLQREGARLLARIAPGEHVLALCVDGPEYSSEAFAARLKRLIDDSKGTLTFVIGGSLGLDGDVCRRADERVSLSQMTLPHRLCRLLLLEQLYRAFKINAHETYHK